MEKLSVQVGELQLLPARFVSCASVLVIRVDVQDLLVHRSGGFPVTSLLRRDRELVAGGEPLGAQGGIAQRSRVGVARIESEQIIEQVYRVVEMLQPQLSARRNVEHAQLCTPAAVGASVLS